MLTIRLKRIGKTNSPYFRVLVQDKRKAPSGRFLEVLGSVDPHKKKISLNKERISHWLSVGAQPSDRVYNMLVDAKVVSGKKRKIKIRIKKKKKEKTEKVEKPVEEVKEEKKDGKKPEAKEEPKKEVKEKPVEKKEAADKKEKKPEVKKELKKSEDKKEEKKEGK